MDQWLRIDRTLSRKQRNTAKCVFDRLRNEYGFRGNCTIVKHDVREYRRRRREMIGPLAHPPGHTLADFGEARVVIGSTVRKVLERQ